MPPLTAVAGPYAWDPHLAAWGALAAAAGAVVVAHRRTGPPAGRPTAWGARQVAAFAGSLAAAAVALTWPVADLAAHWSLTALVTQRLVLTLAVAPLLLLGLPYGVLAAVTRPGPVDAVLERCRRPVVAVAVFTAVAVGSMTTPAVAAQASSPVARGLFDLLAVAAGLVLWLPVIGRVPGIPRLRPVGRFAYLVVQAVVPAFLSFLYIFANHPLYPAFAGSHRAVGLRPLNDQQISGFVSKLSMLFVLLTVGAVILNRAQRADEEHAEHEPLVWGDVEREFERADRRAGRRAPRDGGPDGPGGPPPPSQGPTASGAPGTGRPER